MKEVLNKKRALWICQALGRLPSASALQNVFALLGYCCTQKQKKKNKLEKLKNVEASLLVHLLPFRYCCLELWAS